MGTSRYNSLVWDSTKMFFYRFFERLFCHLGKPLNLPIYFTFLFDAITLIVKGEASTDGCQVFLTYRNGIQEKKHDIKAGVPEKDKLEAFQAIAEILMSKGIIPFDDYSKVKFAKGKSHSQDVTASRTINTPTSLNAILESLENEDSDFEKIS